MYRIITAQDTTVFPVFDSIHISFLYRNEIYNEIYS